jgi:hypothetical protein
MTPDYLNDLDRILYLIERVEAMNIDDIYTSDLRKYLGWAARKTARTYWRSLDADAD